MGLLKLHDFRPRTAALILPPEAGPLLAAFAPLGTPPTFDRFAARTGAAVLTPGRHPVADLLPTLGALAGGHRTSDQRVRSAARWPGMGLGCALAAFLPRHLVPDGPVVLVGDDTVGGHKGKRVYGKARHRDPVRSTHSDTAWRYGHRWVVLAVLARFPFARRPWARPVLAGLYRSGEDDAARHRTHRTPAQLMCRLVRVVPLRFPDRAFAFVGGSGYGTHAAARFCHRHRGRLTRVSQPHPGANRFAPPPPYTGRGRPRVKGARRPKPRQAVARPGPRSRTRLTVGWYGGGTRRVATVPGTGQWYQSGCGPVPIRRVFVADLTGTDREGYFFTTDPARTPAGVVTPYTGRWDLGTTFRECRSCLGLEATRGGCRATALRAAPCPFGLYSVVAALSAGRPAAKQRGRADWPGTAGVTFSDALTAIRRWVWADAVFPQAAGPAAVQEIPPPLRDLVLSGLATAA